MADRIDVTFPSGDSECAAWLYLPAQTAARAAPHAVVVLGHGLGGTREMSLGAFAEAFRADGYACLVFDYRHFGDSGGTPRQLLDIDCQLTDWAAAVAFVRTHPACDADRVVLWGSSFGGGHVLTRAAQDTRIAAVIAQCPFTDGLASALRLDPVASLRVAARAVRDSIGAALGRSPVMVALAGGPRSAALMTAPDALPGYEAQLTTESTFRNEVAARFALQLIQYRPGRRLRELRHAVLLCVCANDTVAPAVRTRRFARRTGAELREYPYGHFDLYSGPGHHDVLADQRAFLRAHVPAV